MNSRVQNNGCRAFGVFVNVIASFRDNSITPHPYQVKIAHGLHEFSLTAIKTYSFGSHILGFLVIIEKQIHDSKRVVISFPLLLISNIQQIVGIQPAYFIHIRSLPHDIHSKPHKFMLSHPGQSCSQIPVHLYYYRFQILFRREIVFKRHPVFRFQIKKRITRSIQQHDQYTI